MRETPHRIAFLYAGLSGYLSACLRKLQERFGVEVLLVCHTPTSVAPYEESIYDGFDRVLMREGQTRASLLAYLERFRPEALVVSGWNDTEYLAIARQYRNRGIPVVATMDAGWKGTFRQHLATAISPWYLHSAFSALWVAGERQMQFARRLGYHGNTCWSGVYACDWETYARVYLDGDRTATPSFLFVGRYLPVKGLDVLVQAYVQYRSEADNPWPLRCAGTGPLATVLKGVPGVEDLGFIQPHRLPEVMGQATALVLPSRHEPWGVVIQEAAAAGLVLLCSTACGAAVHLLQDGYNGYSFKPNDPSDLARCLNLISAVPAPRRLLMSSRSYELSKQYTPERWVSTLLDGLVALTNSSPRVKSNPVEVV